MLLWQYQLYGFNSHKAKLLPIVSPTRFAVVSRLEILGGFTKVSQIEGQPCDQVYRRPSKIALPPVDRKLRKFSAQLLKKFDKTCAGVVG
jgi:hypothetical protein